MGEAMNLVDEQHVAVFNCRSAESPYLAMTGPEVARNRPHFAARSRRAWLAKPRWAEEHDRSSASPRSFARYANPRFSRAPLRATHRALLAHGVGVLAVRSGCLRRDQWPWGSLRSQTTKVLG